MKTILILPIFIIFACKSTLKSSENEEFPSGKYEVKEVNNENFKNSKPYTININAEEKRIGGTFDCNTFSAEYEKDANAIKFDYAIATKMYCEGQMDNENAFMGKLRSITSYTYTKGELIFYNEKNSVEIKLKHINDK